MIALASALAPTESQRTFDPATSRMETAMTSIVEELRAAATERVEQSNVNQAMLARLMESSDANRRSAATERAQQTTINQSIIDKLLLTSDATALLLQQLKDNSKK
jgi:hypothetical protein